MPINANIPLMTSQAVADTGNAITQGFKTIQAGQDRQRRNKLLDLQVKNDAENQIQKNALFNMEKEKHDFEMKAAQGALLHRAFGGLSKLDPESRAAQIELMKPSLQNHGFDDDDWDQLATDEGLNMALGHFSQYAPAQKAAQPTTLERNLLAGGFKPGTPEYQEAVRAAVTKPQTSVTLNNGGDKKFIEKVNEGYAKTLDRVTEEADAAIDANQSLSILENIDVETGQLEPFKQGLAAFGAAFGLDTSSLANVSAGEAFNAEAQRLVLSVKATQKGPQTDKDEATIRKTIANLGNTSQGNRFIISSAQALNDRKVERKEFYDKFIQENGGTFTNEDGMTADQAWSKYKRETPMVSNNLRTPEGLPVFFYKFEQEVKAANPDATRDEIIEAWRQADKKG